MALYKNSGNNKLQELEIFYTAFCRLLEEQKSKELSESREWVLRIEGEKFIRTKDDAKKFGVTPWKKIFVQLDGELCENCKNASDMGWVKIDEPYSN